MAGNFADEKADFHPRSWLSNYRRSSIGYLTKMLLFYHGIGIGLLLTGSTIIQQAMPDYEEPSLPHSLVGVLSAGPLEESLFFGIPFYASGNAYLVLATGIIWAATHLFNTDTFEINTLAFGNLLFVGPSLFFSLRTWVTGKGWFAVVTHSAWNGFFFAAGCASSEFACTALGDAGAIFTSVAFSALLVIVTYALYKRRGNKERQRLAA